MEEDKEILYLLDIAINSYIENDILRLDVSDTTKNRLKRDLRKKFRDEDFIYDIKNNIGLIPKSKVKEKIEELEKANKNWENMYDEDQEYIVELNNKISNLEWKNEIFVKSIKSHKETIKKLQLENIGYQLSQLPDTSEDYKMLRKQLQELLED